MAATTRNQAEAQGFSEQDYVSLDKPQDQIEGALDREGQRKEFDKLTGVYPVFCLTENIPNGVSKRTKPHSQCSHEIPSRRY